SANIPQSIFLFKYGSARHRYFERPHCAPAVQSWPLLFASITVKPIMSDIRNAAVLLMTLPEEEASELMSKLDAKLIEQVSLEIARIRIITADEQERVIKEFTETNPTIGGRGGGLELAKTLLQKALGSNAGAALVHTRPSLEGTPA